MINMEVKHPVSFLQELMARQHKNLPTYQFGNDFSTAGSLSFRCVVRADGVEGVGIASSKQIAKKKAAVHALNLLAYFKCENISSRPSSSQNTTLTTINYNAVGNLNEFTAQKRLPYPAYNECGINLRNEFIIKCNLLSYCSEGCSPTKKVAKQLAAHNMLEQLKEKRLVNSVVQPSFEGIVDHTNDEIIIKKFKELSVNSKRLMSSAKNSDEQKEQKQDTFKEVDSLIGTDAEVKDSINIKEEPSHAIDELHDALKDINIPYSVDIINKKPYVLVLKFDNEHNTTVVESADDYEKAYLNLLQRALKIINV